MLKGNPQLFLQWLNQKDSDRNGSEVRGMSPSHRNYLLTTVPHGMVMVLHFGQALQGHSTSSLVTYKEARGKLGIRMSEGRGLC